MSDEHTDTVSRAPSGAEPASPNPVPVPATGGAPATGASGPDGATGPDGAPKKRRRRGSRGGRNRRKPASQTQGSQGSQGSQNPGSQNPGSQNPGSQNPGSRGGRTGRDADQPSRRPAPGPADESDDEITGPEDIFDAAADRGLTSEDLAADAKEDAGLAPPTRPVADLPAPKPRIGDTRPAPAAPAAAASAPNGDGDDPARTGGRRRRRGGRGRSKGSGGGGTSAGTAAPTTPGRQGAPADFVRADLGVGDADLDLDLDEDALERRRGRTRKGRPAGRYFMCVHVRPDGHTHIAVLEGRSLVEHYVTTPRDDDMSIDGNIYLGRVQNVLPGMEAAFVDIGTPKNGVLYRGDVAFDPADVEEKQPKIERLLKNGQSVLVQVTKNPIGAKGARLTQEVSLAGRFVVLVPNQPQTYGISKRMPEDERRRMRKVLDGLRPPDAGLIVRTAAEGATSDELQRDVIRLRQQWEQISALASRSKAGRLLYQEPPLALRLLREEFTKEYRGVAIDDPELFAEVKAYVDAVAPELADRVELYDPEAEGLPLFERYHVHEQLLKALDRKVWLPSGGSLVIERTEALTVVDVNTGKNVGRSNLEETVFRNNLEAAEEVARQLRLRDIGGIIVIDFIDMEIKQNRDEVMRIFRAALARDKTRTQVFDISELGLVEMTRKRVSEGLLESVSAVCDTCQGRGFLIDQNLLHDLD
jgi:ribonuclease E